MPTKVVTAGLAAAAGVGLAGAMAYDRSPWPRVWLLRRFAGDGATLIAKTAPLVPPDIDSRLDLVYGHPGLDCRLDVHRPRDARGALPAVVWVHGGGFVAGIKEALRPYLSILASHGFATVNVEYTKAPEAHYPTPVHQVTRAVAFLIENAAELGVDAQQIVLGGDSAGAHMVAQAALAATDPGYAMEAGIIERIDRERLAGVALASGPYDMEAVLHGEGPVGWYLRTVLWAYTGRKNLRTDPRFRSASIIHHVTEGFPPAFITAGPKDQLEEQSRRLAERLRKEGADVDEVVLDRDSSAGHVFDFHLDTAEGRLTLVRFVDFLRRVTGAEYRPGLSDSW